MGDFNVNNKPRVEDTYSVNKLKDMNYFWEHLSLETYVFDSTHRNKNNTQSSLDIFVVNQQLKQLYQFSRPCQKIKSQKFNSSCSNFKIS